MSVVESTGSESIRHDASVGRFEIEAAGHTGFLDYERAGELLTITHTVVPAAIGGRGIAGRLVEAAALYARERGLRVRPACSYAATWFDRNPAFADVLERA